jgi:uncharacterized OsmC-like protein
MKGARHEGVALSAWQLRDLRQRARGEHPLLDRLLEHFGRGKRAVEQRFRGLSVGCADRCVAHNPVQPAAEMLDLCSAAERGQSTQKRLLDDVLGVPGRPDALREQEQLTLVALGDRSERSAVAAAGEPDEPLVRLRAQEQIGEPRAHAHLDTYQARILPQLLRTFRIRLDHMDRAELRAVQQPLKERYRNEPASALVTLRADGELDGQDVACSVATGRALVEAGLHPASGGTGTLACSGDMLLQALVACAGVTLRSVATSLELPVTGTVRAEGDLDFRGTMAVRGDDEPPVGFRAIRLFFDLQTGAEEHQLAKLLELTERYCVVYQTLTRGVPLAISHAHAPLAT